MGTITRTGMSTREQSAPVSTPVYRPPDPAPAIPPDADPFEAALRAIARRLRESVSDLTLREKEFLYDLAREEARYPMPTVRKICRIARRSELPEDREAFANLILAESLPAIDSSCLRTAFDLETPAPGEADPLQRALEHNPTCRETWQRCRDALARQLAASRHALHAVLQHGWRTVT